MNGSLFDDEEPQPLQPPAPPEAAAEPFTWSEEWRRECEARHMLTLPRMEQGARLKRIAEKRGAAAAEQLARDMEAQR